MKLKNLLEYCILGVIIIFIVTIIYVLVVSLYGGYRFAKDGDGIIKSCVDNGGIVQWSTWPSGCNDGQCSFLTCFKANK